jgi:hypothetical protein
MSNIKLSHSSSSTFQMCPKKYYYHYIERLRERTNSAALLWGSAIDEALNSMLQDHARNRVDYLCQEYDTVFFSKWRNAMINKKQVELVSSELITYAAADFDGDLIPEADMDSMVALCGLGSRYESLRPARNREEILELMAGIKRQKEAKGWHNLEPVQRQFYNHLNWMSLAVKAKILLRQYIKQILPQITKVLAVQKQIAMLNTEGDEITGFVDAVVEWSDGRIVVIDNKTAAREYDWDAVQKSTQLALYVHALSEEFKTRTAGFIVLRKAINKNKTKQCNKCGHNGTGSRARSCDNEIDGKRCTGAWDEKINPEGEINVLLANIPERLEEIVLENMADMTYLIKQGVFPRSLNSCDKPFPCPYKGLCHANDKSELVDLNEEDK